MADKMTAEEAIANASFASGEVDRPEKAALFLAELRAIGFVVVAAETAAQAAAILRQSVYGTGAYAEGVRSIARDLEANHG